MKRALVKKILNEYKSFWLNTRHGWPVKDQDLTLWKTFLDFVDSSHACFERSHLAGHITGSALIVSPDLNSCLLMHHAKLDKWLQMGGHSDGHPIPHETAMREAEEESGLASLNFLNYWKLLAPITEHPLPFDIDIHKIPARKGEPEHFHYDIRYLVLADPAKPLSINEEAKDLRWRTLDDARELTSENSMLRQFKKVSWLKAKI